jgi:exonuclease III
MTGDFNLVQDPILDYHNYNNVNNPEARKVLLGLKESHGLVDERRIKYEKRKGYTWFKKSQARFFSCI